MSDTQHLSCTHINPSNYLLLYKELSKTAPLHKAINLIQLPSVVSDHITQVLSAHKLTAYDLQFLSDKDLQLVFPSRLPTPPLHCQCNPITILSQCLSTIFVAMPSIPPSIPAHFRSQVVMCLNTLTLLYQQPRAADLKLRIQTQQNLLTILDGFIPEKLDVSVKIPMTRSPNFSYDIDRLVRDLSNCYLLHLEQQQRERRGEAEKTPEDGNTRSDEDHTTTKDTANPSQTAQNGQPDSQHDTPKETASQSSSTTLESSTTLQPSSSHENPEHPTQQPPVEPAQTGESSPISLAESSHHHENPDEQRNPTNKPQLTVTIPSDCGAGGSPGTGPATVLVSPTATVMLARPSRAAFLTATTAPLPTPSAQSIAPRLAGPVSLLKRAKFFTMLPKTHRNDVYTQKQSTTVTLTRINSGDGHDEALEGGVAPAPSTATISLSSRLSHFQFRAFDQIAAEPCSSVDGNPVNSVKQLQPSTLTLSSSTVSSSSSLSTSLPVTTPTTAGGTTPHVLTPTNSRVEVGSLSSSLGDRFHVMNSTSWAPQLHLDALGLRKILSSFEFSIFALDPKYMPELLIRLAVFMFVDLGVVEHFQIPIDKLIRFIVHVSTLYRHNPYHNWQHAFTTLQYTYLLIVNTRDRIDYTDILLLSMLLSALCHDIDHPGNNNAFEVTTMSKLALLHNDISVLENHHCYVTFSLLATPEFSLFQNLTPAQFKELRQNTISIILNTDMTFHNDLTEYCRLMVEDLLTTNKIENDKSKKVTSATVAYYALIAKVIVHCADIAGQALPVRSAYQWADLLRVEFGNQVDTESRLGLPITPFMAGLDDDRKFASSQAGFIRGVLKPLWVLLVVIFPQIKPSLIHINRNERFWQKIADSESQYTRNDVHSDGRNGLETLIDDVESEIFEHISD